MAIMMDLNPQTPGVYIYEVPSGARPIQAVGTRTAGFVGLAPNPNATQEPVAINNWTEFRDTFFPPTNPDQAWTRLAFAVYGFFLNGGSRCFVVNVGGTATNLNPISGGGGTPAGLDKLERIDEIAIVAAPGYTRREDYAALLATCTNLHDRVAILDGPEILNKAALDQLNNDADPPALDPKGTKPGGPWIKPFPSQSGETTLYVPWITVSNPDPRKNIEGSNIAKFISVPPSGHVAGIWARSDALRGVHKAPANEIVQGALDVQYQIKASEQATLNPKGVNCIRYFTNDGILVWGARTFTKSQQWRYLNVRRLFNMIEESIAESTRWIVFEPNDRTLWNAIRRDVTAFLMGFWRDGALMGATPEQAFFVKCDEENNPQSSIDQGKVVIEIGIAPVKPAEFVIFKISQFESGSEVKVGG